LHDILAFPVIWKYLGFNLLFLPLFCIKHCWTSHC